MGSYVPEVNSLISPILGKAMINLPDRNPSALNGTDFGSSIISTTANPARDSSFMDEIMAGNVPSAVRTFTPITIESAGNTLQYLVSSDVLSIGSDNDYLRITLAAKNANKVCDSLDCMLPTKKISDDIWKMADLRLVPHPMGASPNMINTQTLVAHNQVITAQIGSYSFQLISGIKKDIVICKHLLSDRSRLCIYGWHQLNGIAIQGQNSTSHGAEYEDYSQGIRLVSRKATLNDQSVDLYNVLNNPATAYLISEEGAYDASSIYT